MMESKIGTQYLNNMQAQKKDQITKVFDEYKALLSDKIHPDNQTPAYHKNVQGTIQRLLSAAHDLDQVAPGEGLFGLFALILSTNLKLKNKIIEQEVEINRLKRANKKKGRDGQKRTP